MRLTAFPSDKGDCLLLESKAGDRILIDGGMDTAYSQHVAAAMGALRKAGKKLDVVYVSHIDEDHISGVLQLLDDEAAWRVHAHQKSDGNSIHEPPAAPRPPEIGAIFHNSFHDQIGHNRGPIEDLLAATATILSGSEDPWVKGVAEHRRDLATSVPQALRVSQRIKAGQLNLPLNPHFDGKLMLVQDPMPDIDIGTIHLQVIGPFDPDVKKLRTCWNNWLRDHQRVVKTIRAEARADRDDLGTSAVGVALGPLLLAADRLGAHEFETATKLGRRSKVTTPNLASLMFLASVDGRTVLLTGDGHQDDILKGLDHHGAVDPDGTTHVNILKVQHHGSENNIDQAFCDTVTADHYVFCANGEHENPDLAVLQLIYDRRMAGDKRDFKFWFNSSSKLSTDTRGQAHMKEVETLVARLARRSRDRLSYKFSSGGAIQIPR